MIPKGMKVGDVFCDGGLYFEVQAICAQGYISKRIEKPTEEKDTDEKGVDAPKPSTKKTRKAKGE